MEGNKGDTIAILLGIAGVPLVLFLVNFFVFPSYAGFLAAPVNPYFAAALVTAALLGRAAGAGAFVFSLLLISIPFGKDIPLSEHIKTIFQTNGVKIAVLFCGVYLFGHIRDRNARHVRYSRNMAKQFKKENAALLQLNSKLEENITRQNESVTELYSQIKSLHTQSLTETLNVLLSIIGKSSRAEKASIWCFDGKAHVLAMIACMGWDKEDYRNTILDIDESIEGWCFRNNKTFSADMLLQFENLRKLDKKRNLLTLPILFSNMTWGVLNIEKLPEFRDNRYVEKLLSILVDLASPAIERAVEYESGMMYNSVNSDTGLPSFGQLQSALEKSIDKAIPTNNTFSLVLFELVNMDKLTTRFGLEKVYKLILEFLDALNELSGNRVDYYHYREVNQFALFHHDIDYDGISLFCLETLGMINSREWKIDGETVLLDIILGYSSFAHQKIPAEELLAVAENLLEMQKV